MTWIDLDAASSVPAYEQIIRGIKYAIARGDYAADDRLPSVRQVALDLLVNPNTVAKAYRELERAGIVYTRQGAGVFVQRHAESLCRDAREEEIARRIEGALREAARAGLTRRQIQNIVERELRTAPPASRQSGHKEAPRNGR